MEKAKESCKNTAKRFLTISLTSPEWSKLAKAVIKNY